jgi:hypothetical protein
MDFAPDLPSEIWHKILFDYGLSHKDVAAVRLVIRDVVWPRGQDLAKWQARAGPLWCMKNDRPRALVLSLKNLRPFTDRGKWYLKTALFWGCKRGHADVVKFCLSRGCDPNRDVRTFQSAARGGHEEIVRLLQESARLDFQCFVLKGYCEGGHLDLIKACGLGGYHPSVMISPTFSASRHGHSEVVRYLVSRSAAHPEINLDEFLETACRLGHLDVVDALISEGADPSTADNEPIKLASKFGRAKIVSRLLADPRVDPAASDNRALRLAIKGQRGRVQKILLADGRVASTWAGE